MELYVPLPNLGGGQYSVNNNQKTDAGQFVMRVDHSLSGNHKIYGRTFRQVSPTTDADRLPAFRNRQEFRAWNTSLGDTWIIRPTVVNLLTVTLNRTASLPGPDNRFRWRDLGARAPLVGAETDLTNSGLNVTAAFGFQQRVALRLPRTVVHLTESISFNRGSHFVRVGFEGRHIQEVRRTNNNVDGAFTFSGQFTRVPIADFQLGMPNNFIQFANLQEGLPRNVGVGWFVQDDWKVSRRLTLNIGLRLDPFFPVVDQRDRRPVFRPGQQSKVFPTAPPGMVYPGDDGVARGTVTNQWNKWAPRFGLAWDVFGNGRTSVRAGYGIFYDYPSTTNNNGFNSQPYSFSYNIVPQSLANPYGSIQPVIPYIAPSTPEERARARFILPTPVLGLDAEFTSAYSHQYNFSIEQALPRDLRATVSYVGAIGIRLPVVVQINPAVYRPGATVANTDARRIHAPNFQDISYYSPAGTSSFHSFQTTINRRFSSGFTLMGSYVFGKSMDIASDSRLNLNANPAQNPFDLRSEHAPSDYDVKHTVVASWIWEIPFFRRTRGFTKAVLGGWQLSQILTLRSGGPFSAVTGRDNSFTGINKDRPNVVGDPALPGGRPRGEQIQQYFNRAAFGANAIGAYGNAGRNILRGPGRKNTDMALAKDFPIGEKLKAQFRAESFNAFNNVNLGAPGGNLSTPAYGRIVSAEDGRIYQLALKLGW